MLSLACAVLVSALAATAGPEVQPQGQRYSQYVDDETGVVKKPERDGFDDPFGDGVWRSSWFYASLLVIQSKDPATYQRLQKDHGVDVAQATRFLRYFRDHCTNGDEWKLPKNNEQKFSGDQLAPLLYLLASVNSYGSSESKEVAKDILNRLVSLDERRHGLSDSHQGQIRDNQRYVIDAVCRMYDIDYIRGFRRDLCKVEFTGALKVLNAQAQSPDPNIATRDDYSVFNTLAVVTVTDLKWGKDDEDVDAWRKNFRVHADKGWGPAFRIVSGRSQDPAEIEEYATAHITRGQDNDIIMAQRPRKYLSGEFNPSQKGGPGQWLVLDYVILKGLKLAWQ